MDDTGSDLLNFCFNVKEPLLLRVDDPTHQTDQRRSHRQWADSGRGHVSEQCCECKYLDRLACFHVGLFPVLYM